MRGSEKPPVGRSRVGQSPVGKCQSARFPAGLPSRGRTGGGSSGDVESMDIGPADERRRSISPVRPHVLVVGAGRDEDDPSFECPTFDSLLRPRTFKCVAIRTVEPARARDHFEQVGELLDPGRVVRGGQTSAASSSSFACRSAGSSVRSATRISWRIPRSASIPGIRSRTNLPWCAFMAPSMTTHAARPSREAGLAGIQTTRGALLS